MLEMKEENNLLWVFFKCDYSNKMCALYFYSF